VPLVGPCFPVALFFLTCPCDGLFGLQVMGHGDRVCRILGGEMGRGMQEGRVLGGAEWYGGVVVHRGPLPPGPWLGSICVPPEVARECRCCGGIKK